MIKLIIYSSLYFLILLNIKLEGNKVSIEVKIKDDWEEKREYLYLKNVELKERFYCKKLKNKTISIVLALIIILRDFCVKLT